MYEGTWQAQNVGPTRLVKGANDLAGVSWEYGRPYRITIKLSGGQISASVAEVAGKTLGVTTYELGTAMAVRRGRVAVQVTGGSAVFDNVEATVEVAARGAVKPLVEPGPKGVAAIVPGPPGMVAPPRLVDAMQHAGFGTAVCDWSAIVTDAFWQSGVDVVVLPDCRSFPAAGLQGLEAYVRDGGKLVAIGGQPFERNVWQVEGRWLDSKQIATERNATKPERVLYQLDGNTLDTWQRASDNLAAPSRVISERPGAEGTEACLRFDIADLENWETVTAPRRPDYFKPGQTLTCFCAKGGPRTAQIVVEWIERDGARWIATVPLSTSWQRYALPPQAFHYWQDSRSRGRGGPSDSLKPGNVDRLSFGVALSHCGVKPGDHVFWLDQIGLARDRYRQQTSARLPTLEAVSPYYKVYPLEKVASVRVTDAGRRLGLNAWPVVPRLAHAPIPRPTGQGFNKGRTFRWTPLASCLDEAGLERGAVASLVRVHGGVERGAAWLYVGQASPDVANEPVVAKLIAEAATLLVDHVGLAEAGTEHFCYFKGEPTTLGAKVFNCSPRDTEAEAVFTVIAPSGETIFREVAQAATASGRVRSVLVDWQPPVEASGLFRATTELRVAGEVVDRIEHEFRIVPEGPVKSEELVQVVDDHFELAGKWWAPFGINFWPTYVAGCESLSWLEPQYYQPNVVERNLALCQQMGMNVLSIQDGSAAAVRNLRDFVERAYARGMRVNVFLHGSDPLSYSHDEVRAIIEGARLAETPAVFAYDLAWEHRLGRYRERCRWDRQWSAWIAERYTSLAAAERDWQFAVPRRDGQVTGPSNDQLLRDGPWRVMVATYRRFADDLLSQHYREATAKVRSLDPNHLVSVRSGYGGTGPCSPAVFPVDIKSGAKHLDFVSPEGWGMVGDAEALRECGLTTAYCRFAGAGKPVFWCELGMSVWDSSTNRADPSLIQEQGCYYERFLQMLLDSGANGAAPWYFPGGYRVNERSDYGIVAPDFTLRPAVLAIQRAAASFATPRPAPQPTTFITVDRDAHPGGYWRIYHQYKETYGDLMRQGQVPGVRTPGTGTTSATCPLVAVGNTTWNGENPPKYLNAEFNEVRSKGRFVTVSVGNLEEAKWLAPHDEGMEGGVWLLVGDGQRVPISNDVGYHEDIVIGPFPVEAAGRVTLQLAAHRGGKDARFGEIGSADVGP